MTPFLTHPAPPVATMRARTLAGAAIDNLSLAEAFGRHDPRRADRHLDDAIDALDEARRQLVASRDVCRAPPAALQAAAGLAFIAAPLIVLLSAPWA